MYNLPQFILHRDKRPCSPAGQVHNPHDPAIWMSYTEAQRLAAESGAEIGFVLTEADPYWFLDIDDCLTADGQWSELATSLCTRLTGCYIEVSRSGRGLHIIGSGPVPAHGCKNQALKLEFYTSGRYVALTGTGAQGSADYEVDLSRLVAEYFPPTATSASSADPDADWTTSPDAEWDGPDDDTELIKRMLRSKQSPFSSKAGVKALWQSDEDALAASYPNATGTGAFDHSSADAALCQYLAFWTGRDCERMDQLFRQSELCRDKWLDREDYRQRTILGAVGLGGNVYKQKRSKVSVAPQPVIQTAPVRREGYQYLAVDQQLEHFNGCVYVRDLHRAFTPDGALLRAEQFKAIYGGYVFAVDATADKTVKNAWEAFTESQAVSFPKAHGICFRPERPSGELIIEESRVLVNTYVPIVTRRVKGDPSPFMDLMTRLLPDAGDRAILVAYMAACVQYPGVKFQWCPLLQGTEGNGKTIFTDCLTHAVGSRYTHLPNAQDLGSKFNAWVLNKLFIGVEEVYVSDRREALDALKPLITNRRIEIQGKGIDQITGDNRANFLMCSNHKDAILKTSNDRRYCVFYTAQQSSEDLQRDGMTGSYFPTLYKWLRADGYSIVNDYLASYAIPDALNPATECHRAPPTTSTSEALQVSLGGIEQEVIEAIESGRPGFCLPWVSSLAVDRLLAEGHRRISRNRRRDMILSLGYIPHPGLPSGRVHNNVPTEGGRPVLYIRPEHLHAQLTTGANITREYLAAQEPVQQNPYGQTEQAAPEQPG